MPTHDLPEISKPLHVYAIVYWVAALVNVALSFFLDLSGLFALFFLATLIELFWSGAFQREVSDFFQKCGKGVFCRIVFTVCTISFVLFLLAFFSLFPGSPDIVDGVYVRASHGEITATLTQQEWQLLTLCEQMSSSLFFLCVSSNLLNGIHALYRMQHPQRETRRQAPPSKREPA